MIFFKRNQCFSILFLQRIITNLADSLYSIALTLFVYTQTHSVLFSGFTLFLTSAMGGFQLLLSPILHKFPPIKTMLSSQITQGILLAILAGYYSFGGRNVFLFIFVMVLLTIVDQVNYPLQSSILPKVVSSEDLTLANSLFAMSYQTLDIVFNAISGICFGALGFALCTYLSSGFFFINVFLFALLTKHALKNKALVVENMGEEVQAEKTTYQHHIQKLFRLIQKNHVLPILIGVTVVNFGLMATLSNLPKIAQSSQYYGFFISASSLGLLIGTSMINIGWIKKLQLKVLYSFGLFLSSLCWMAMAVSSLKVSLLLFFLAGIPIGCINVNGQILLQRIMPEEKLANIFAFVLGISTLISPIGAIFGGVVGENLGGHTLLLIDGLLILLVSLSWMFSNSFSKLESRLSEVELDENSFAHPTAELFEIGS